MRKSSGTVGICAVSIGLIGVCATTASAGHSVNDAPGDQVSFVDPTADGFGDVQMGDLVYVAPFAQAAIESDDDDDDRRGPSIVIGDESNVQDNVLLDARSGQIRVGEQAILAHNAAVVGESEVGETGVCPDAAPTCPSFVGFNSVVDGAVIEKDAMVQAMGRVAPGVRIPSGRKVLPGRYVRSQAEVSADTEPVTSADRTFMAGVIEVNTEFAVAYSELETERRSNVRGVNVNPMTTFNDRDRPTLGGRETVDPKFRNRIIGDVRTDDSLRRLDRVLDSRISLRADEGDPFPVGTVDQIESQFTVHALESAEVVLGNRQRLGEHSVVHGGGPRGPESTRTGDKFTLGDLSVFFRAQAGNDVRIGDKSLVQGVSLPSGTTVGDCTVVTASGTSPLEWCRVPFPSVNDADDDD